MTTETKKKIKTKKKILFLVFFLFLSNYPTNNILAQEVTFEACPTVEYCQEHIVANERQIANLWDENRKLQDEWDKINDNLAWIANRWPDQQKMKEIERQMYSNRDTIQFLKIDNITTQKLIKTKLLEDVTDPTKIKELEKEIQQLEAQVSEMSKTQVAAIREEDKLLNDGACWSGTKGLNIGACAMRITGWIGTIITSIFALLLWASSKIFDASVYLSIADIGKYFNAEITLTLWRLSRDIANMFFLFILLYIAIGTIFDLSGINDPKKLITNVVIIALLVNFSGFFVRVVVDASNLIAYEFYSSMGGEGVTKFKTLGDTLVKSLLPSQHLIKSISIEGASEEVAEAQPMQLSISRLSFLGVIGQTFGNIIIIFVASFILLVASILFIIRTVTLLLIYVISPIALTSMLIPSANFNIFKTWKEKLISQALFAPGFLIPLFFVFLFLSENGLPGLGGTSGTSGWSIIGGGIFGLAIADAIIVSLFISCIFIAQKAGAVGLGFATNIAGKTNALAARGFGRVASFAGRRTGQGVASVARRVDTWARANSTTMRGAVINRVREVGEEVGSQAGEVWNSKLVGEVRKEVKKTKAAKLVSEAVKNPMLAGNDLIGFAAGQAGVKGVNIFGSSAEARKAAKDTEKKEKEEKEEKEKKDREKKLETANQPDAATILGGMTDAQIKILPAKILTRPEVALNLDHDALTAINKEGKLTKDNKKAIKHIITGTPPEGTTGTTGLADAQIWVTTGAGATWPT